MDENLRKSRTAYTTVGNTAVQPEQRVYENTQTEIRRSPEKVTKREKNISFATTMITATVVVVVALVIVSVKFFHENNIAINSQSNGYIEQISALDTKINALLAEINEEAPTEEEVREFIQKNQLVRMPNGD